MTNSSNQHNLAEADTLLSRAQRLRRLTPAEKEAMFDRILSAELSMQEAGSTHSEEKIQRLRDTLQTDGSWPGIDYADQRRSDSWSTVIHLSNIESMLTAAGRQRVASEEPLRTQALLALDYWLEHDFICPNWWHNEINVPARLCVICLYLWNYLDNAQQQKCIEILRRGTMLENAGGSRGWTGANLIWGLKTTVKHALLLRDVSMMAYAMDLLEGAVVVGEDEGIQSDSSFFQHGHQLAMGHYGWSYVSEITRLCCILTGTPFQISTRKLNQIARYIAEGTRYIVYQKRWNFFALGRAVFRNHSMSAADVSDAVRQFALVEELDEKKAVSDAADALAGLPSRAPDKYFDVGKYYCRFGNGYYIGARMADPSIVPGEICNGEGILGYNLAAGGVQCVFVDGREYDNIFPVWDYAKIPGVTTLLEDDESIVSKTGWTSAPAQNSYSGGITDGNTGAIYMDIVHNGITGVISRFFIDGGMIALGAGLRSEQGRVITTVNQCWKRSDITTSGSVAVHDSVTYLNLCSTPWIASVDHRTGSWKRVAAESSDDKITGDVFSLCYNHGECPQDAQYAYALLPNRSDASLCAEDLDIDVLQNTATCQAIRTGDKVIAVFHTADSLRLPDGSVLTGEARSAKIASYS